ncbi:MAG: hypothetical protein IJ802_03605 [Kiritimatiellae bacterium]|nr:hypothetical protein [Kiritimatiellia bacterium]
MGIKSVICTAAIAAGIAFASGAQKFAPQPNPNPMPSGGLVVREPEDTNVIVIRNLQTRFTEEEMAEVVASFKTSLALPVKLATGDEIVERAGATVTVEDSPAFGGATLLVAPEQGWSRLAVGWLLEDAPEGEKRIARLEVELMRAVAASLGVGYSIHQPCIMSNVESIRDLDKIALFVSGPGPETENNLTVCAKKRGIGKYRFATYRRACQQGWAPAPTNDVQRAIWDEVASSKEQGPANRKAIKR